MNDTYLTRDTLINRLKSKEDDQSWEEFIANYGKFIYSIISTLGITEQHIDDLYQQISVKIWNSIDNFDRKQKKGSFRNWIYTLSKHTVLNFIKREQSAQNKYSNLQQSHPDQFQSPEIEEIIDEEWNKHISELAFENISKKVSERAMQAFVSQFEGEAAEETAKRLGYDIKTIYIYRARIKSKLMAEIQNLKELLE